MSAHLALQFHPAGVTVYIQTNTNRTLLVEDFSDTLYCLYNSNQELFFLKAPTTNTPSYMFTGIIRRLLGLQISETSLLISQCLELAFNAMQLTSRYFELVINETLSKTALQTKDIVSFCIIIPDSFIVPLMQVFMQLFPAVLSLVPSYISQSHIRALHSTLRGAEDCGLPTGLHFQLAIQVSSCYISMVSLGTRFLSKIAANGDKQYSMVSQLATCFHSCSRFVANIVDRTKVLCYQKLMEMENHAILLEEEMYVLKSRTTEFLQLLYKSLLDALSCALYNEAIDFRIILPSVRTHSGYVVPVFLSEDLNEILVLSAQESYNCTEVDDVLQDDPLDTVSNDTDDLQLEELSITTSQPGNIQSTTTYFTIIKGDFFYKIARELIYACNDILDSIVDPLVEILSSYTKTGVRHLLPLITLYQNPDDCDILFDFLRKLLEQRFKDKVKTNMVELRVEQDPLRQYIPLFFNSICAFKNYIISHYTLDIDVSYPLGQQSLHFVQDNFLSEIGIPHRSTREQIIQNIDSLEKYLVDNFRGDLSILNPPPNQIDITIEQEVDIRISLTNTMHSPFLQEDTLHGLVLRRPLVISQYAVSLRALYVIFEPTLGLGILAVRRVRDYLNTCEAVVKICGLSEDINLGFPREKIICWDAMKDFISLSFNNEILGHNSSSCAELLKIDLGAPTHISPKLSEPTCRVLLDITRRNMGCSVPWYIDLIINRTHAVLPLHYFSEDIHLFLTGEMHNRFITRNENLDELFRTGKVYYGLYKNRLHSIFLFNIECFFGPEAGIGQQGPLQRSRSILSPAINSAYIALMEASLNFRIGSNLEHLIQVVDILYDKEQEIHSQYAAVITELLFPLNLSPLPHFEESSRDLWIYFQNIKIIDDLRCLIKNIGEHGSLHQQNIYYNSRGVLCTMVRPRCLRDQDFLSLPNLFGAFRSVNNYVTSLSSSIDTATVSDYQFLYRIASLLMCTTFSENEFDDALTLYRKMYDIKSTTPITKISLIDCTTYHTIRLLQFLSQSVPNQEEYHPWYTNILATDVVHSSDRLLTFSLLIKTIISNKIMQHHPAITALRELPITINNLDDIAIIIRAWFVYELSNQ